MKQASIVGLRESLIRIPPYASLRTLKYRSTARGVTELTHPGVITRILSGDRITITDLTPAYLRSSDGEANRKQ